MPRRSLSSGDPNDAHELQAMYEAYVQNAADISQVANILTYQEWLAEYERHELNKLDDGWDD